jgi:hypothetical protein
VDDKDEFLKTSKSSICEESWNKNWAEPQSLQPEKQEKVQSPEEKIC